MALFQKSVEKKYLNELDSLLIDEKFEVFEAYFHNPEIQENIRNSKEEQFQEGFLRELFVKILGYTLNPQPNFNLTTELKNIDDSKKADGAILRDDNAIAVIELKSTNTTDLNSIETQAFGYKNHHPRCVYVITSNFEKLRFYINNALDKQDFDLFNLTKEEFALMWLCIAKDNLMTDLPLKIKNSSVLKEENVTKELYTDYSKFREAIYNNLVKKNPDKDKLLLFKKTQKLLDRFLFIFFAEDKLLVPPNSISQIVDKWKDDIDFGESKPLYSVFKQYFHVLNVGRPKSGKRQEIFAYNGGLFIPDEILDNIIIDDQILKDHTLKLSKYDFETEVDVNILGHIFEHSLGEIENVQAEIKGEKVDNQKTKRKKDGIFYTPKYITKYIVENTVGKLCEEKKTEMKISGNLSFERTKTGKLKKEAKDYYKTLEDYREWLLTLTILDPACGSGAFLNQALEFLIEEHNFITEQMKAITGDAATLFVDVEKKILEKNIFGVDLNEESIEIAKLSLWLRTAQKGRQLNTLSNNIKCGNSLIDDPEVAGEKAFNWQREFPEVFAKGGFDMVIGNPPYVNIVNIEDEKYRKLLQKNFKTFKNKCDLYSLFIEKSILLSKSDGELGFIFPNSWMGTSSFIPFRKHLSENMTVSTLVELPPGVFEDAVVTTIIMTMKNTKAGSNHEIELLHPINQIIQKKRSAIKLSDIQKTEHYAFSFEEKLDFKSNDKKLKDIASFSLGIKTSNDKRFVFDHKIDENSYPMIRGKNIGRYFLEFGGDYLWYMPELIKEKPGGRPRVLKHFLKPKIIIQDIAKSINATYDDSNYLVNDTLNVIYDSIEKTPLLFILGLLNSKAVNKWFSSTFPEGLHIKINQLQEIPIPNASESQINKIVVKVESLLLKNKEKRNRQSIFLKYLTSQTQQIKLTSKFQNWDDLEFSDFINELNKAIKKTGGQKLTKMDEMEWMEVFEAKKAEVQALKAKINKIDKEIDQMFYELYGVSEEEIRIVEGSAM